MQQRFHLVPHLERGLTNIYYPLHSRLLRDILYLDTPSHITNRWIWAGDQRWRQCRLLGSLPVPRIRRRRQCAG